MEVITLASRLRNLSVEHHVEHLSAYLDRTLGIAAAGADPLQLSLARRVLVTWMFLYLTSLALYFVVAGLDYLVVFRLFAHKLLPPKYNQRTDVRREITMSVKSLLVMTLLSVPTEILAQTGYSKLYHRVDEYGWPYLVASPILFLMFSDCVIYFIHRGLHHRSVYKYLHKPHHSFINTTPFAAFAFHPVDGYLQGIAYHVFIFIAPMHGLVHLVSLAVVSMWTINIHDRVSIGIPGVNGARHHAIHHTTFKSNYGQYTTFWDKVFGTWHDPWQWAKNGEPAMTESQIYGKDA